MLTKLLDVPSRITSASAMQRMLSSGLPFGCRTTFSVDGYPPIAFNRPTNRSDTVCTAPSTVGGDENGPADAPHHEGNDDCPSEFLGRSCERADGGNVRKSESSANWPSAFGTGSDVSVCT